MDARNTWVPSRDLLDDASISPALADRILRSCWVRDIPARSPLYQVDDYPGGMWCLAEGALSVELAPGVRDPQMSYLLLPPAWVGEGTIVDRTSSRLVGLSTTRRSTLLLLPLNNFFHISQDEPQIWRWLARVQKLNFERAIGMVDALMVRRSKARVVAVLTQLGGRLGHHTNAPRTLDITQDQLAGIANMSRSVLSPILNTLASTGAIKLGHSTITIADPAALGGLSK